MGKRARALWSEAVRGASGCAKHDNIQGVYAMKKLRIAIVFWGAGLVATTPAWGVSKEILQLQTQMQLMQEQMTSMQRSFDERMGVMQPGRAKHRYHEQDRRLDR